MAEDTAPALRVPPDLVGGIEDYCNRWCARCPMHLRCARYRSNPARALLDVVVDPVDMPADVRPPADALGQLAREYAEAAAPIARALEPLVMGGDHLVGDAVEVIARFAGQVAERIEEAVSAANERADLTSADPQHRSAGAAKVALLAMRDSRRAWRILMEQGRASANGVPARLAESLSTLERATLERFPLAMAFVRPGFDEDA
jgi:hypothetical protein